MAKVRDDLHGDPKCPKAINDFLLKVGGKNPYGEPKYRLIHTTTRLTKQGGKWQTWQKGLSIAERGGTLMTEAGILVPSHHQPEKVEICIKEVLKYPDFPGWMVERWMPASFYGAKDDWERLHLPGHPDIPFLGPYPVEGDYESVSSVSSDIPSIEELHNTVKYQAFVDEQRLQGDLDSIVRQRCYEAVEKFEDQMRKEREENEYRIKDFLSPWKSLSLEASRWKNDAARKAGVKEHA